MTVQIALLRGVNVGGNNKVPMTRLRELLTGLGFTDVKTYLQSGNAVFTAPDSSPDASARAVERSIAEDLGLTVAVLVITREELAGVIEANPYPDAVAEPKHLHVTCPPPRPQVCSKPSTRPATPRTGSASASARSTSPLRTASADRSSPNCSAHNASKSPPPPATGGP
ncbi:DUF1697 domain-containing protein [Streptomyces sp. H27-D2]|uniref:DUF1697 domain-containing protein n=1 Tax=Streptomyces sp. H27-D2 TaxID=3046304 RepID=UPI002DBE3D95|nr:DUF1697 domain-containing protein [Streptomyces sp. H27-D2]MEC4019459.1 DUF1697 domain-containing protein [Streptomyces sp. H27-D2]